MKKPKFSEQEPINVSKNPQRYQFILNSYRHERISKCPLCSKLTHNRKFPLLIDIESFGPFVLGKTCRYCTQCELIIAHQHELEEILAMGFAELEPSVVGNPYKVLGTVDRKTWQRGCNSSDVSLQEMLKVFTAFSVVLDLKVTPGGWFRNPE